MEIKVKNKRREAVRARSSFYFVYISTRESEFEDVFALRDSEIFFALTSIFEMNLGIVMKNC